MLSPVWKAQLAQKKYGPLPSTSTGSGSLRINQASPRPSSSKKTTGKETKSVPDSLSTWANSSPTRRLGFLRRRNLEPKSAQFIAKISLFAFLILGASLRFFNYGYCFRCVKFLNWPQFPKSLHNCHPFFFFFWQCGCGWVWDCIEVPIFVQLLLF